jgi:hypothetical protein
VHQSLDSIPTANWYARSPKRRVSLFLQVLARGRVSTQYIVWRASQSAPAPIGTRPLTLRSAYRSLSLDDISSAPAALFTPWVRRSPSSFPDVDCCTKLRLARHPRHKFNSRGYAAAQRNTCHRLQLLQLAGAVSRAHCLAWQGLTISPDATSPVAPTRASPSPPTSSNGPYAMDETLSRANGQPQAPQTVSAKNPKAAAAMANDMNIVRRKLTGYVGFANLPNQWHRKSVRKGFNFNVMVVGTCQSHGHNGSVLTQSCRRVWSRKVYPSQHPLQHFAIPTEGAQAPVSRHLQDCLRAVHQRRH